MKGCVDDDCSVDWWRTFFSGMIVESWLKATTAEQTRQEADFIRESLRVPPPARLLDVPCGGGRHCHALAELGYDMTGVDISAEFLEAANAPAAVRSRTIAWEHREMRDLPWPEAFDGAYSFGNSFGYLDDEGNAAFLEAVANALKPGARFVLDTGYVAESLLPVLQERAWYPIDDMIMLAQRRYDPVEGRLHVEYTPHPRRRDRQAIDVGADPHLPRGLPAPRARPASPTCRRMDRSPRSHSGSDRTGC